MSTEKELNNSLIEVSKDRDRLKALAETKISENYDLIRKTSSLEDEVKNLKQQNADLIKSVLNLSKLGVK